MYVSIGMKKTEVLTPLFTITTEQVIKFSTSKKNTVYVNFVVSIFLKLTLSKPSWNDISLSNSLFRIMPDAKLIDKGHKLPPVGKI